MTGPSKNIALALITLSLAACSGERKSLRQESKEINKLGEAAGTYWQSIRWSDYGSAAAFYLDQDYRMNWMNQMVESPDYKYSAASVIRVEVSPAVEEPTDGVSREGRVFIQVQGYRMPEQVMEQKMITQAWALYDSGWFIAADADAGE